MATTTTTTYWAKSSFIDKNPSSKSNTTTNPPWITREYEGRGLCAFATREFDAGDIIVTELPLVSVNGHDPFTSEQLAEMETNISYLSIEEKEAFYAMANSRPNAPTQAAGIFMTNSFDMTHRPAGPGCAIYCAIGRLNHSCCPNTQQTYIPETGEEVLVASRRIEVNEELNDCYIDLRMSRKDRQQELLNNYGFLCSCSACSCPDEAKVTADDTKRKQAMILEEQIINVAQDGQSEDALDSALELVKILKSPDAQGWSVRYIASAYMYVYLTSDAVGLEDVPLQSLRNAHQWNSLLQGNRTPDSIRTKQLLQDYIVSCQDEDDEDY